MGVWNRVTALVRRRQSETLLCECRQCGTTLDSETAVCPTCGSTEIARYQFA